ncbi:MAG: DUF4118 domain-containing protein [Gallionellaceae bacterium]|nr:DUF4118 domain-containing protein [Gallionellaceae bacterium]
MKPYGLGKYGPGIIGGIALTLLISPFRAVIDFSNIALLYVLLVVVTAIWSGRGPAIVAAFLGSLAFAYVFVPPYFSLAITEDQHLLSALIMLVVALLVGHLTSKLKNHVESAEARERHSRALYVLASQLTATQTAEEARDISEHFLTTLFSAENVRILSPDTFDDLPAPLSPAGLADIIASRNLAALPVPDTTRSYMVLPLRMSRGLQGVLVFTLDDPSVVTGYIRESLETMSSVVAVALERVHYAELAKNTEVKMASETLRGTILSALSHDLRTPLTALVGLADTVAEGRAAQPDKQRAMMLAIRDQALGINRLVGNLLEMARLQSGAVTLNKEWQPVEEVIGASLQQMRLQLEGHRVTVKIMPALPPVAFDAVLIERAICNLLENAAKYSPLDSEIILSAERLHEWLDIAVCDRGKGLPEGDVSELFGVFRRGQRESNIPGLGLGLAIVRNIVEAHGGSVDAHNRKDGGACFRFWLPLDQPPAELAVES